MSRKYTYYSSEAAPDGIVVTATTRQFEDSNLEDLGFERVDDPPEGVEVMSYREVADAMLKENEDAEAEQGDGAADSTGDSGGGSEDSLAAEGGSSTDGTGDAGDNAADGGDDAGVSGEAGTFEGRPDPNNYRNSSNEGFIRNPVAGGADPEQGGGLGDFVNGVQPEEDQG